MQPVTAPRPGTDHRSLPGRVDTTWQAGVVTPSGDTIIVVEDDHNISDLVAMYLRREGFRVLQADDAEHGLAYIDRENPTLLILDIGLPGKLDGLELCRQVRKTSDVPVIILTAREDEIDRVVGLELGADDYVTKPFSPASWWPGSGPSSGGPVLEPGRSRNV